jgi:peroxiredoxin Q/BCP
MAQLRQDFSRFEAQNTTIVVLGPEKARDFQSYWRKERLPFIGLPDPSHSVLKQYGQEVNLFKLGRMPAQVIIDRWGSVRFVHYGHQMSDIPENEEVLGILKELNQIDMNELEMVI